MGMKAWDHSDTEAMMVALAEARQAAEAGEIPVGAIVVRSGRILGRGRNRTIERSDPTAHAEIVALRAAAGQEKNYRLPGTTLYVTLEPCPMCLGAAIQARVARIVFGAYDERAGAAGSVVDLSAVPEFNHRIEVNGGLEAEVAADLLSEFFAARRPGGDPTALG